MAVTRASLPDQRVQAEHKVSAAYTRKNQHGDVLVFTKNFVVCLSGVSNP